MEILNKEEIDYKRAFNQKIIHGIKNKKIYNEISIEDFRKNIRSNFLKMNIDKTKKVEIKKESSIKDIVAIKDIEEKNLEKNSNSKCPKVSFQPINLKIKINFNNLKKQLMKSENAKKQKYVKDEKLKEIRKQKGKNNIKENNIFEIIILKIIIINILRQSKINTLYSYKLQMKYNKKIIKSSLLILILIIGTIIIFIKDKFFKGKKKAISFMNKRQYEMIKFLGIKNESHKSLNSNELHDNNNIIKMQEKNRKYNIKQNNITKNDLILTFITLIKSIILINLLYKAKSTILNQCLSLNSKITLKVKGIGENKILGNYFNDYIDSIYINENRQETISQQYNFDQNENSVEIIFKDNNNLNNLNNMFSQCTNITEMDLSQFNASLVTNMGFMFQGCTSLTSLNLTNFNTSFVNIIRFMFKDCSSLTSLNLSHFNTSLVTDMGYMFQGCSSLTSLDLSNFNTASVTNMQQMFSGCVNLEYINLYNFDESKISQLKYDNGLMKIL